MIKKSKTGSTAKFKVGDVIRHTEYTNHCYEILSVNEKDKTYTLNNLYLDRELSEPKSFYQIESMSRKITKLEKAMK